MSFPTPEICNDYKLAEGCSMIADPAYTLKAEEHFDDSAEDMHFCAVCRTRREDFLKNTMEAFAEGYLDPEEFFEFVEAIKEDEE